MGESEVNMNRFAIGNNIHEILKERKMSQSKLAEAIGIDMNSVSKWMNGRMQPNSYSLYKIAKALGVPMERRMEGIENE